MSTPQRSGRRLPIWLPTGIFLVAIAAYGGFWLVLQNQSNAILTNTLAQVEVDTGIAVKWRTRQSGGFPGTVATTFSDLTVMTADSPDTPMVRAEQVRLDIPPLDFQRVIIRANGPVTLGPPNLGAPTLGEPAIDPGANATSDARPITITAQAPVGSVKFASGRRRADLSAGQTAVRRGDATLFSMAGGELHAKLVPQENQTMVASLVVTDPDSDMVASDHVPGQVLADVSVAQAEGLVEAVGRGAPQYWQTWREAGGEVSFRTRISWGPATVALAGTVTADNGGLLDGEARLVIVQPDAVSVHLQGLGVLTTQDAIGLATLGGLAQDDTGTVRVPLTIRGGDIRLLGQKLGHIGPLHWLGASGPPGAPG